MSDYLTKVPESENEAVLFVGLLRRDLTILEKNVLILRVRSRIEELERRFLKAYMLSWARFDKWNMILRGDARDMKKKGELRRFRPSITVDLDELIETIVALCGELSDAAAHGINHPINFDEASIKEMLTKFGITPDQSKVDAVLVILKLIP